MSSFQYILILGLNIGLLSLLIIILWISRYLCTYNGLILDQESQHTQGSQESQDFQESQISQDFQDTNHQMYGHGRPVSIIRTISLPTYEKAVSSKKVETPPPKYLDSFFPTKLSPTLDTVAESGPSLEWGLGGI